MNKDKTVALICLMAGAMVYLFYLYGAFINPTTCGSGDCLHSQFYHLIFGLLIPSMFLLVGMKYAYNNGDDSQNRGGKK